MMAGFGAGMGTFPEDGYIRYKAEIRLGRLFSTPPYVVS